MPGWQGSDRRSRLPKNWQALRRRVARRDGEVCQVPLPYGGEVCGKPYDDIDHIVPGDDHSPENLRAICSRHHNRKTQQEAAAGRTRAEASRRPR